MDEKLLLSIDEEDAKEALENYAGKINEININDFVRHLMLALRFRPFKDIFYLNLFLKVVPLKLKHKALHSILSIYPSDVDYEWEAHRPHFALLLLENDFITPDDITGEISNLKLFNSNNVYLTLLFFWFAPEISGNQALFGSLMNLTSEKWRFNYTSMIFYDIFNNFHLYKENNWERLKTERKQSFKGDLVAKYIENDSIDELQSHFEIFRDFNQKIKFGSYDWKLFRMRAPTYVEYAAFCGSIKCFKFLMLSGASFKSKDILNNSINSYAIAGGNIEIIRILEQEGVDFSKSLKFAALFRQSEIFEWLLEAKQAKLNGFHFSAISNNIESMKIHLSRGIDVNSKDSDTLTALHYSISERNTEATRFLFDQTGINIEATSELGMKPIHFTAINGCVEEMKLLIDMNVDINSEDNHGLAAAHYAVINGHIDILKILIETEKIDPNHEVCLILMED